ncbi:MAG: mechanosensitive ion channel domain-containing protein, partial [bacterium]
MKEIFNYTIFQLGDFQLKISSVFKLLILVLIVIIVLYIVKRAIDRTKKIEYAKKYSLYKLAKYIILVFAVVFGLQILEFNLSILLAGSAALLVGIGLGIQNLFSDYISGIIILMGSTVKVNDIIEVNGL